MEICLMQGERIDFTDSWFHIDREWRTEHMLNSAMLKVKWSRWVELMSYLITRIERKKNYKNEGYGVCLLVESEQESIYLKWFATGQSKDWHVANVVWKT